ncbi:MAG: tRNA modification GTPase [Nitrospirae bacterium]|nr:tRNA modification GTPase [Nitrospirota bacterium]
MDSIVAPVTALVPQPVGILRLSGLNLWQQIQPLFPGLPCPAPRKATLLTLKRQGQAIDSVLVLFFPGPHSFTGEDVVEIQAHGNPQNIRSILHSIEECGIRQAKPGEFSLRAYKNGKISLLKAESLHRMITAPTYGDFLSAHSSFSRPENHPLATIKEAFLDLLASFYAFLDYPEELTDSEHSYSHSLLFPKILTLQHLSRHQLSLFRKNRRVFSSFSVLLAGPPNSGKSSLFNRLLQSNRAIVSPYPGTTRDLLEGRLSLPFGDLLLLDSAGFRSSNDLIEGMGISKARKTIAHVDRLLWVTSPETLAPLPFSTRTPYFTIWNKVDLSPPPPILPPDFVVSARTRKGLRQLLDALVSLAEDFYSHHNNSTPLLDSERQAQALSSFLKAITRAEDSLRSNAFDLALTSLEEARNLLEDGTGMISTEEIYDRVFSRFCLGK